MTFLTLRLETPGEVLYCLDLSTNGPTAPTSKPLDCCPDIGVAPEMAELLLEHVHGEQSAVWFECLIQVAANPCAFVALS